MHGNITEAKQSTLEQAQRFYERMLSVLTAIGESIGRTLPPLQVCLSLNFRDMRYRAIGWGLLLYFMWSVECCIR